jgi:flagellar FliL protein
MAAEEATGQGELPKKRKMSGKKLVLFILLPVLLLGGGGAAAYFLFLKKDPQAEAAAAEAAKEAAPPAYFEMPKLQVNLLTTGKRPNYLNLTLWLEVAGEEDSNKLKDQMLPRITDAFQVYLRSLRIDDLQGADGVQRMRDELLRRARDASKPVEIKDVLIKEMLAQ